MSYKIQSVILKILFNAPSCGMTTQEIFNLHKTKVFDYETFNQQVINLRKNGLLTSSSSVNGRHKITHKGIAALDEFNMAAIKEASPKI